MRPSPSTPNPRTAKPNCMPHTRKLPKGDEILLDLFKARSAAKAEKARFAHAVQLRGGWKCVPDLFEDEDEAVIPGTVKEPCWRKGTGEMCEDCRALQPFHTAYRKAATKAGAALRRATQEGWRLFQSHH